MDISVAVIGAGNGGTAIAAYFASRGAEVRLCDLFPEYLTGIQEQGSITLHIEGQVIKASPALVTAELAEAVKGAQLIMVVTPAFTHKLIAEKLWPYLEDGQVIVLNPGRTAGALEFLNTLRKNGCERDVVVAETQTLIYSARKTGPAEVYVYGVKETVSISAFPGNRIGEVLALLGAYYPQFKPTENVMETSLMNIGSMFHPTPILCNIGRIENDKRGYRYYWDGITPSVAKLIEQLDAERLAVGEAYGVKLLSAFEWLKQSYGVEGETLYERISTNEAYGEIKAPSTIQARYMTEDVPNGLVPIAALGEAAGVATPNINAVITLACSIYGRDFRAEGRSLRNLGLEGMSRDEIIRFFQTGKK